jgi:hypothetical protein
MRRLLLLCSLLAAGLSAQPSDIRVVGTKIYAPNEMVKPIYVDVTVKNMSNTVEEDRWVHVRFVPNKPSSYRRPVDGDRDVFSPVDLEKELGSINPGESRTIRFRSPYLAKNAFNTTGRSFRTEVAPDLPINGTQTVNLTITIK